MTALDAWAAGPQAWAQTPAPPNRTVNLNYVYAADLGFDGLNIWHANFGFPF